MNDSLMARGRAQQPAAEKKAGDSGGGFTKPNIDQFVPPALKDIVQRVVAAGVKVMYSPQMREQVTAAIESRQPVPQKLAENVTGLMLTLDQQTPGGIPVEAIFPVGMELLGEAAEVLEAAGQTVTQEDYNEAARMMYVLIGQKLGGSPEELMQGAAQAMPAEEGEEEAEEVAEAPPSEELPPDDEPVV